MPKSEFRGKYRGIRYDRNNLRFDVDECTLVSITVQQVQNLIDLADVLRRLPPPEFDMNTFVTVGAGPKTAEKTELINSQGIYGSFPGPEKVYKLAQAGKGVAEMCGTSCCAVGTAAYHGIATDCFSQDWITYSDAAFGVRGASWDFLFSDTWVRIDNDPEGAAARILYLLSEGLATNMVYDWDCEEFYVNEEAVKEYAPYREMKITRKPKSK